MQSSHNKPLRGSYISYMRSISILLAAIILGRSAAAQATCHAPDDESARVIYQISGMMDTAQRMTQIRSDFGIPLVSLSEIVLVSDSAVCARAGQALDSLLHVWNPNATIPAVWPEPLYVFKIGSSFAAMDRSTPNQPAYWVIFLSPLWAYKAVLRM